MLLPDDLMAGKPGALKQMVDAWEKVGGICSRPRKCRPRRPALRNHRPRARRKGALTEVRGLVEKPDPSEAPSRLGVIGRYILQPEVMQISTRRSAARAAKSS